MTDAPFAAAAVTGTGTAIIFGCAVTLLLAPRIALRERAGWYWDAMLAALLLLTLLTTNGVVAFTLTGAVSIALGYMALRVSRTAALSLALSGAAAWIAGAAIAAEQLNLAYLASIVAIALRTGIFPLQSGVAALADRSIPVQVRQMATLPVLVLVHLRYVNQQSWAFEFAAILVGIGTLSTVVFALIALTQRTLPGLLRASMLMHGGMIFASVGAAGRGHHAAAILVAITLGLALSGFGIMLASFEARVGPLDSLVPGGRARAFPRLAAALAVFGGAAVGLPGTAGFVADDLLLHALWQESVASAVATIVASALLAVATLSGFARAFLGHPVGQLAPDLRRGERVVVVVLLTWLIALGIFPRLLVDSIATLPN